MPPASARGQAPFSRILAQLAFFALSAIWLVIAVRYSQTDAGLDS